jgi:hypothetical protein
MAVTKGGQSLTLLPCRSRRLRAGRGRVGCAGGFRQIILTRHCPPGGSKATLSGIRRPRASADDARPTTDLHLPAVEVQRAHAVGDRVQRYGFGRCHSVHPLGPTRPFAASPIDVPPLCIQAGCKPGGLVLDVFCGTGTGLAALDLDRPCADIELSPGFAAVSRSNVSARRSATAMSDASTRPSRRSPWPPLVLPSGPGQQQ